MPLIGAPELREVSPYKERLFSDGLPPWAMANFVCGRSVQGFALPCFETSPEVVAARAAAQREERDVREM